uniref:Protein SIEVE ELEMENT OCCLUSION B-like n=1 Tax=Kalanchoe fedtschenkoi TaxID=63787 RepID=A0A7N0RIT2_KALFE
MQLVKSDRRVFSSSEDTALMRQVQATHVPDGREIQLNPILIVIEDVVRQTSCSIDSILYGKRLQGTVSDIFEDTVRLANINGILDGLAYTIQRLSCQMSCKCIGGDPHALAMATLNMLQNFAWDTKVVLALAAFSTNFGEFGLLTQLYTNNELAKSVGLLKHISDIMEHSNSLRSTFDAIDSLTKIVLEVTKCMTMFKELPPQYISTETPAMATALDHIPNAAYWTIRSILACASQISGLLGLSHQHMTSTTETWELSNLAHKLTNIYDFLRKQLTLCHQHIDEKRHTESYHNIVRLFETLHLDNIRVLKTIICSKDDHQPLIDGSSKARVNPEVLRNKHVLLLISDLDISNDEIMTLNHIYKESHTITPSIEYYIIWLPIVDEKNAGDESHELRFQQLQSMMSWFVVHRPSLIEPAVTKYIKEVWHFKKKTIMVTLDQQGQVASTNALHMMWIWGNLAYPFTNAREEALWKGESWRLELLVDGIDPNIQQLVSESAFICLYGGDNIEWIREFTFAAKAVAATAGINLHMYYVGKSNINERLQRINQTIAKEHLSHYWPDPTFTWFFWTRLESMLYSKLQHGKTAENDHVMNEVMKMLSFDGSDQGWALMSLGSSEIASAKGNMVLTSLMEYETWSVEIEHRGFINALNDYFKTLHTPHHCNRLILSGNNGVAPETVLCADCGRLMEKFVMYRCCLD